MVGLTEEQVRKYNEQGFLVVENFLEDHEIEALKNECHRLVNNMDIKHNPSVIRSGDGLVGSKYFMESGHKIHYFFEEKALSEKGDILADKKRALDKIAHALHWLNPVFKAASFSEKVKAVAKSLNYIDPVVVQSMYIFKHPNVAGKVKDHQDETYLHTEPNSCIGFWYALEDVTLENGCLHFIPGSHKGPLKKRMIRNPDKTGPILIHTAPNVEYDDNLYVSAPVKKGSLVLLHGKVIHKSGINTTNVSREVYTFHMVESHNTVWSNDNWMVPSEGFPFPSLYRTLV